MNIYVLSELFEMDPGCYDQSVVYLGNFIQCEAFDYNFFGKRVYFDSRVRLNVNQEIIYGWNRRPAFFDYE